MKKAIRTQKTAERQFLFYEFMQFDFYDSDFTIVLQLFTISI